MKRIITITLFISLFTFLNAQTYTFPQAYSWWSSSFQTDEGLDVAVSDSLVAVVGKHGGTTFHVGNAGLSTPTSNSGFLTVVDTLGNFKPFRSKSFYGDGFERAKFVSIDHAGNFIVSGTFTGTAVTSGSNTFNKTLGGNMATFLVKYDQNGDLLWGKVLENDDSVRVTGMEVDSEGDIVLSGDFKGSDLTIGSNTLTSQGSFDGFVAMIKADGDDGWGFSYGRDQIDIATDVYVTPLDSVFVAGAFYSDTLFIENDTIANASTVNGFDGIILKLDSAGNHIYSEGLSGPLDVIPTEVMGYDNVLYFALEHESTYYGHAAVGIDVQIFKYTDLSYDWRFVISNDGDEKVSDLAITPSGVIAFGGYTEGLDLTLGSQTFQGSDFQDFYIGLLSSTGSGSVHEPLTATRTGGLGNDRINAFSLRGDDIWTVGDYDSDTLFVGADTLVNFGDNDIFLGEAVINLHPLSAVVQPASIEENSPEGTLIGSVIVTDPNEDDTHTFHMDTTSGDNAYFRLNIDGELYADTLFDFEQKNSYTINYLVFDDKGGKFEASNLITIYNVNEKPDSISISNQTFDESTDVGSVVGTLTTYDQDSHPAGFIYSLVDGQGDTGNDLFRIEDDKLVTASVFDYETSNSTSVRVRTDDQNGQVYDTTFEIQIINHKVISNMDQNDLDLLAKGGDDAVLLVELDESANRYVYGFVTGEVDFQGNAFTSESGYFVAKYDATNTLVWIKETSESNDMLVSDTVYLLTENELLKIDILDGTYYDTLAQGGQAFSIYQDTLFIGWETLNSTNLSAVSMGGNVIWTKTIPSDFYSYVNDVVVDNTHAYLSIRARSGFTVDGVSFGQSYESNNSFLGRIIAIDRNAEVNWGETFHISPYVDNFGTDNQTRSVSLAIDSNGDIIYFGRIQTYDDVTTTTLTIGSSGYTPGDEGFFVRYNSSGTLLQVSFIDDFRYAELDANDNIYTAINKYNSDGTFLWQQNPGVRISDIAVSNNEVVFCGDFTNSANFAGKSKEVVGTDAYFASYDNIGNEEDIEYIGSDGGDWNFVDVVTNGNGDIVTLGSFYGSLNYDDLLLQSNGADDFFLVKYNIVSNTLQRQWISDFGTVTNDDVTGLSIDDAGNTYVIGTRPATQYDEDTVFVQKVSPTGDSLWTFEAPGFYLVDQIVNTESGDVIFAGAIGGSATIDGTTYTPSQRDVLIVKLLSNGAVSWVKQLSGASYETIEGLEAHGDSVYVAGEFNGGTIFLNGESLNVSTNYDLYLAKLDHLGQNLHFRQYDLNVGSDDIHHGGMMIFGDSLYFSQNSELTMANLGGNILETEYIRYDDHVIQSNDEQLFLFDGNAILEITRDLDIVRRYADADPYEQMVDFSMSGDTLIQLFQKSLYQTIYRQGPEGFSLSIDTLDENHTGFAGVFVPENPPVQGTYEISGNSGKISLSNDSLFVEVPFDFETTADTMVRIIYTDSYGETIQRDLELTIRDKNDAPTDILVEAYRVSETDTVGTPVAKITGVDPDAGDIVSFYLPDSTENENFYLDGDTLRIASQLNYEAYNSPSNDTIHTLTLYLEVIDLQGLSYHEEINSVELVDVNEMPDTITAPWEYKDEVTNPTGTIEYIYTISPQDEDHYSSFRSENKSNVSTILPDGLGDNDLFTIQDHKLYFLNDSLANYELDSLYQLMVKVYHNQDSVILPYDVKLRDKNDPLDSAWLSIDSIPENVPVGTPVGVIHWADEDALAGYEIEEQVSPNEYYDISGDTVYTAREIDFELSSSINEMTELDVVLEDTAAFGTYYETLPIHVLDRNDAPELTLTVDPFEVQENLDDSAQVNIFNLSDQDGDEVTATFVTGAGDEGNDHFEFDPATGFVKIVKPFNYEASNVSSIRVNLTDHNGYDKDTVIAIQVTDVNDLPDNIQLSDYTVPEVSSGNDPAVGVISFDDEDEGNSYVYSFGALSNENTDADYFYWHGDTLRLYNNTVDYEQEDQRELFIRISLREDTDEGSFYTTSDSIIIQLTDVNDEKPVVTSDQSFNIDEDAPAGTSIGILQATDPDENTQFESWTILSGNEDDIFSIDSLSGELFLAKDSTLNYSEIQIYSIQVKVSDGVNFSYSNAVDIQINDVNFAPAINEPLENVEVTEGFDVHGINFYNMFSDRDGDQLTYTATSDSGLVNIELVDVNIYLHELDEPVSGIDSIRITADDGNGGTVTDVFGFVILPSGDTTGINLFNGTILSNFYPNPTKGEVWVELISSSDNAIVNVYTVTGERVVQRLLNHETKFHITIPGNPGIYFIEIDTGEFKEVFSILKQ